ncbi:hypothetical protein D9619_007583 [Psilocybe cf. subviscida]|uniref:peptide-methionine (S)-S-oxide reductase n=1 Tax=Psilocybe cf. subviscida TaxID=2480587 RepID=A0A8H5B1S8_9AGAR|nr:hypothetical protein D9619_007583 [Psilocybe cf. subviscida]
MFSILSSFFSSSVPIDAASYRAAPSDPVSTETAYFASGCFWGTEHIFQKHYGPQAKTNPDKRGILSTAVGYTGGNPKITKPSYEQVCSGRTDHAEAIKVEFDPRVVSYAELVEFFYRSHDPTTKNRQGNDSGTRMPSLESPYARSFY